MEPLARYLDKLYKKESEHEKSPSVLSRLEIDNLKTQINRELYKIRTNLRNEGVTNDEIDKTIRKIVCSVFSVSINNGEVERMADFLFLYQQSTLK